MRKIKCLVTAGPTREFFDPVRFISNPSSGKMGLAVANAAKEAGWEVSLVLGPTALPRPQGMEIADIVSADDMLHETSIRFPACDILIMTAAVSDMRPKTKAPSKVKKDALDMFVEFEQTPDILKTLSMQKTGQILIGFAAETDNIETYAKKKLLEKKLDAIAANNVSKANSGFESDTNALTLIFSDGENFEIPFAPKSQLAKQMIQKLTEKYFYDKRL